MIDLAFIRTERLVLRPFQRADAPLLKEAVDGSLPELVPWLPWAVQEPTSVEELGERLERFRNAFEEGTDRIYGIFDQNETRVLGGTGLHPRVGPDAVEIGYWVRTDATGQGIAREATAALVTIAFEVLRVERVEIRTDPKNARSRAIPRRLGFVHTTTLEGNAHTPSGARRDTEVWTLRRATHPSVPTVRSAELVDADAVAALNVRAWQTAYRGMISDAYLDGLGATHARTAANIRDAIAGNHGDVLVTPDANGDVAGFCWLVASRDTDAVDTVGEIVAIYAAPERLRRGIGRALMTAALRSAAQRGFVDVTLWTLEANAGARHFYEALGFRADGTTRAEDRWGGTVSLMRYRKSVNASISAADIDDTSFG